jgi:hypothetical protein
VVYTMVITKDGKPIFTYAVTIPDDHAYAAEVAEALDTFRMDFKETSLLEEDIAISFEKQEQQL